jgi:hypothetical protein
LLQMWTVALQLKQVQDRQKPGPKVIRRAW